MNSPAFIKSDRVIQLRATLRFTSTDHKASVTVKAGSRCLPDTRSLKPEEQTNCQQTGRNLEQNQRGGAALEEEQTEEEE